MFVVGIFAGIACEVPIKVIYYRSIKRKYLSTKIRLVEKVPPAQLPGKQIYLHQSREEIGIGLVF